MINYSNNGVKVVLVRKVKSGSNSPESPIYWRVTHERKQRYYFTGFSYDENGWCDFIEKSLQKHKDTKSTLQRYFDKTLRPIIDSLVEEGVFSFEALNHKLGKSDISNLNEAFRAKITELYEADRVNYAESFKATLNSLEGFRGKDIAFNSITPDFLRKYEKYLTGSGKSMTTVGFYTRNIRTVINGGGEPYLKGDKYPFGVGGYKYTIPKGERREKALELGEIHMIQAYNCEHSYEIYRDLWLFSFYGNGINVTDICRLRYDEIQDGEITFIRKKTKSKRRSVVRIYIPMTAPIKEIIKKHGNKNRDGCIFPFLNSTMTEKQIVRKIADVTKAVNDTMHLIAKELKFVDGITTYSTRHSYVTILERLNVPRIFIQNSLGHTSESVTDNYSKMAEKELRFKYNSLLLPKSNEEVVKSLVENAKNELIYN